MKLHYHRYSSNPQEALAQWQGSLQFDGIKQVVAKVIPKLPKGPVVVRAECSVMPDGLHEFNIWVGPAELANPAWGAPDPDAKLVDEKVG